MKTVKLMVVVAALAITVSAFSADFGSLSARQLGMGGAAVAVADDAFAWSQNPAGLASANIPVKEGAKLGFAAAGSYAFGETPAFSTGSNDFDGWDLSLGAVDPAQGYGFGLGYAEMRPDAGRNSKTYGAGFGIRGRSEALQNASAGVAVRRVDDGIDKATVYDLGLMYTVKLADVAPVKLGLVVNNVGDKWDGRSYTAGVSVNATPNLMLAGDLTGIGQSNRSWRMGGEYKINEFALRAGDADGALALGAGYKINNWCIDAAHSQKNGEKLSLITVSTSF